jgi:hypothetical protein
MYGQSQVNDAIQDQNKQIRSDMGPYRGLGEQAAQDLQALQADPSSIEDMPGYQFQLGEGNKAIQRSAAARGGLFSGKTLKDMDRFSQGHAQGYYQNEWNRLYNLAGMGQNAAAQTGAAQQNPYAAGNLWQTAGQGIQSFGNTYAGMSLWEKENAASERRMQNYLQAIQNSKG